MAAGRVSTLALRKAITTSNPSVLSRQRRWARVLDVRFLASHPPINRIQDRYRDKLEKKAKEQGLKGVDELKEVYSDKIKQFRDKAIVPGANAPLDPQTSPSPQQIQNSIPYQAPPPPTPQSSTAKTKDGSGKVPVRTLESFINIEKTSKLPHKEIEAIWRLCHMEDPQSLCAVMESSTYDRIAKTARQHPQFILPLPREGQGAEIHFLQWTFPSATTVSVLFTHLAEFKLKGEYAQPHTIITYHLDMSPINGLVLLEGRVTENRGIAVDESKWLLMCLQKFYGFEANEGVARQNAEKRQKLMKQFSSGDENFKIEELLEEAEKVP